MLKFFAFCDMFLNSSAVFLQNIWRKEVEDSRIPGVKWYWTLWFSFLLVKMALTLGFFCSFSLSFWKNMFLQESGSKAQCNIFICLFFKVFSLEPLNPWPLGSLSIDQFIGRWYYFMTQFNIFIIRAVFGAVFAVILTRMFYGKVEIIYVAGLAVFLVGMAYVMEYFRKKRKG